MYKPTKVKDKNDVISFINGTDIFNSCLLNNIKDKNLITNSYTKNKSDLRVDISTNNIYGKSTSLLSFISLYNKFQSDDNFDKLTNVDFIDKTSIDNIVISSMK